MSQKLEAFFAQEGPYQAALIRLRELILETELEETYKWQFPVYTLQGKNVVGLGAFKKFFGVWFFQGALLSDPGKKLINAQVGKTAAMRQWRFDDEDQIDEELLRTYLQEAILNQKAGLSVPTQKPSRKKPKIPLVLKEALTDSGLQKAFENFTPGKQKEFIEYLEEPKREGTKVKRLEKIIPMILRGEGLNDKYR